MKELFEELNQLTDQRPILYASIIICSATLDNNLLDIANKKLRANYDRTVEILTMMEDLINASPNY